MALITLELALWEKYEYSGDHEGTVSQGMINNVAKTMEKAITDKVPSL